MVVHYLDLLHSAVRYAHQLPYITLLTMIALDIFTGIGCSISLKKLNSGIAANGIIRKVLEGSLPLILFPLFEAYQFTGVADSIVVAFIIAEAISVVENLTAIGVPIPKQIVQFLDDDKIADKAQKFINERK